MRSRLLWISLIAAACGTETVGLPDGQVTTQSDARSADARSADAPLGPDAAGGTPDAAPGAPDARADAGPITGNELTQCTGRAFPAHPPGDWRHPIASPIVAAFEPYHAADDALVSVTTGGTAAVMVGAKFQYSTIFKDLEDETIRVYLDDCSGWQLLGTATTDGDGRISYTFPALGAGIYDVRYEVVGDATTTPAQLWILPRGTHLTVYDIDGTLTTSDFEIIKDLFFEILTGDYVPEAYPKAAEMTWAHRDMKRVGVYITGRPYWLRSMTREWLAGLSFAPGPVFLTRTTGEALPTEGGVGDFKKGLITGFGNAGFLLDNAQGNATTDIYAYLGSGIPPASAYIIGDHGGESGTVAVVDTWAEHVTRIEYAGPVDQPFDW